MIIIIVYLQKLNCLWIDSFWRMAESSSKFSCPIWRQLVRFFQRFISPWGGQTPTHGGFAILGDLADRAYCECGCHGFRSVHLFHKAAHQRADGNTQPESRDLRHGCVLPDVALPFAAPWRDVSRDIKAETGHSPA